MSLHNSLPHPKLFFSRFYHFCIWNGNEVEHRSSGIFWMLFINEYLIEVFFGTKNLSLWKKILKKYSWHSPKKVLNRTLLYLLRLLFSLGTLISSEYSSFSKLCCHYYSKHSTLFPLYTHVNSITSNFNWLLCRNKIMENDANIRKQLH